MLSNKMMDSFNNHLKEEFSSAYIYLSMSAHSSFIGLKGFAKWFMAQYHEEMAHAMMFYEYIGRQGGKVRLLTVEEPSSEYASPIDMFEKTLEHEKFMTKNVNDLMELAIQEKDHATQIFLQWFVSEQVEEEETVNDILAKLKLIGSDTNGLFMMDTELGTRTVTMPTDFTQGVEAAIKAGG